ncbi:MAG: LysM peptidoglycan-binding domain-containing protein [Anaerolineae bacterium]|jgi:LysM repeat protein|nr:LysM peptidoglycan-binding domain-containing protein [Anaerolineae bacterium]MCZ7553430.1 LysM peptidoglycan-binding domain-containing protein [Anaerolineales bacterium]
MESETKKDQPAKLALLVLSIALVLTLLVSAIPQTAAQAVTCKFKHTVLQGETLIYLGNLYNVDYLKIAKANNLNPPYALIVGQVLCIPEGEKPANQPTKPAEKGKGPSVQVVPGMNRILVSVENFAKKTTYFIRITPTHYNVTYRLGQFTTNKEGDATSWFRVPYSTRRTPTMTLCLKNAWTDAVSCVKYDDIFVYYPFVRPSCGPKEPR